MEVINLDKDIIYESCEKETHITTDDTEDGIWTVYTRQPRVIAKLQSIATMTKCIKFEGRVREAEFKLEPAQVIFSKIKNISPEERARRSERMKEIHKNKSGGE